MTTISYPAKGTGGLSIEDWAILFDGQDGAINDYAGTGLALTRINAGEIARYSPGLVRVAGYILEVTANHDLTVSTSAATYYTWACYDPALNIADGGGAHSPDGPCTLGISSGLPSTTGSKQYVILDRIVRAAAQALTATTVTSFRRWFSGSVEWEGTRTPESVESDYPRGTLRYDRTKDRLLVRTMNAAGNAMEWKAVGAADTAVAFPSVAGLVAFDAPAQTIRFAGNMVQLRGTLKKSNGSAISTGANVTLGTLAAGSRPGALSRFACTANGPDHVSISIATSGVVTLDGKTGTTQTWLQLDTIIFRAEA